MRKAIIGIGLITLIWACKKDDKGGNPSPTNSDPNILLIIADDMGLDATNGYTEGSIKPNTPNLDALMNSGLRFTNFWTNTVCSPTRASIITGKYSYHTGVLSQFDDLASSETTLQHYINRQTGDKYATAIIGKWHLGGNSTFNPEIMGIDHYAGIISGTVPDYYSWDLTEDGVATSQTEYVTTKLTDLAIDWVNQQSKPWFLWLAHIAPHTPFHLPPQGMHSQGSLSPDQASIDANPQPYFMASIEAMDYQLGRLLESLDPAERQNTVVIFIGDNGTTGRVAQQPYGRTKAKGTLYQGGINCPMFISGAGVSRSGTDNALINSTDLFATIASLAGVNVQEINNSKSFTSLLSSENPDFREYTYAEYKLDNEGIDRWCIRNNSYKLIEEADGSKEFYDLQTDPYENSNLLNNNLSSDAQQAKDWLEQKLSEIRM